MKEQALWTAAVGLLGLAMTAAWAGEKRVENKQADDYPISARPGRKYCLAEILPPPQAMR